MIGVQDFCGHYDWTFEYIRVTHGKDALQRYWSEAIAFDSQRHAYDLFRNKGIEGMAEYWGHTLEMEEAGYAITRTDQAFRIDMHKCPSKGYLLDHNPEAHEDYCAHCMGWIGPVAEKAGFTIDHEHNHLGQCWWELRRKGTPRDLDALRQAAGGDNVESDPAWHKGEHHHYRDCRKCDDAQS
ncbi:MAG: hypothetical protein KJ052_08955 [Candidatus Hydrogenedentes bacterium]|nr:hypothetical protein [Candidatus Hydrogenedentota bacterium]